MQDWRALHALERFACFDLQSPFTLPLPCITLAVYACGQRIALALKPEISVSSPILPDLSLKHGEQEQTRRSQKLDARQQYCLERVHRDLDWRHE